MNIPASSSPELPVVVIGAGPIGLAAAAHLVRHDEPFVVLEAGPSVASSVRAWSHVTLFTPWRYDVDAEAAALLDETGWTIPDPERYPTGAQLVEAYLDPLASHPKIAPYIRFGHRVTAIARDVIGKLEEDREDYPLLVQVLTADGREVQIAACAVIDASGAWSNPNPLGANGLTVPGERDQRAHILYGVPDVLGVERDRYAGKRTLVVGSGHSALNALKDLTTLTEDAPSTSALWAIRRTTSDEALAACDDDTLTERTLVKKDIRETVASGRIEAFGDSRITRLERTHDGLVAYAGHRALPAVDEIIVATGFRPDLSIARELRLDVHSVFESTYALAPLIDPGVNACGTVPPHGVAQLAHPEPDFYIVGMKSYGRAPTFLLLTGYEQVRSVVCAIVGDEDALVIKLDLPEKGLCSACTAFLEDREHGVGGAAACGCSMSDLDAAGDDACCDVGAESEPEPALATVAD